MNLGIQLSPSAFHPRSFFSPVHHQSLHISNSNFWGLSLPTNPACPLSTMMKSTKRVTRGMCKPGKWIVIPSLQPACWNWTRTYSCNTWWGGKQGRPCAASCQKQTDGLVLRFVTIWVAVAIHTWSSSSSMACLCNIYVSLPTHTHQ